jgi:hypothetical protein
MSDTGKINLKEWSKKKKDLHDTMSITRTNLIKNGSLKKKLTPKQLSARILMICFIAGCIAFDIHSTSKSFSYTYKNVLSPVDSSNPEYQKVCDYISYLTQRIKIHKNAPLYGKWLEGVPESFKNNAEEKLKALSTEGFVIDGIFEDKNKIYHIKCHALQKGKKQVALDITKIKIKGNLIFRLVRIY